MIETPEHLAEAGGEDEQPHQRPHERRQEPLALMQEAQHLAPHDAAEAGEIGCRSETARSIEIRAGGLAHAASLVVVRPAGHGHERGSRQVSRPASREQTRGLHRRSSTAALVQQHDLIARRDLVDQVRRPQHADDAAPERVARTIASTLSRDITSRPTVASSSSRQVGRCSNARAISTRRACPPDSKRTLSPARSASPTIA